jgi:hypothetical protein
MTSSFPGSPSITKGAIISFDLYNPIPKVVQFQYNPDTLTRSLEGQSNEGGSASETSRLNGPPKETISLEIEFDTTDKLEHPDENEVAKSMGVFPQLSALEMMLYPSTPLVIANTVLAAAGTMEIVPVEGPFTLFIWGAKRVVPVKLTQFNITEEAHDTNLNPIRAKVQLGMRVLTYNDFSITHPGYAIFLAHQVVKETMSIVGTVNSLAAIGKGVKIL